MASSDAAGLFGHRAVQQVWRFFTGAYIDSQQAPYAWILFLQKTVHVVLYGTLGLLCGAGGTRTGTKKFLGGLALCLTGEALQYWSRTRTASWRDVWLNVLSFVAAFAMAAFWNSKKGGAKA